MRSASAEFQLLVNGKERRVSTEADTPLLWVLRDQLGLRGTKYGCGRGLCGACTVQLEGAAVRSCQLPVAMVVGRAVTTIEGLQGKLADELRQAWIRHNVPQCGYCQAGQLMSAESLLSRNAGLTRTEIVAALHGNLCRCGTYPRIIAAVSEVAATSEAAAPTSGAGEKPDQSERPAR